MIRWKNLMKFFGFFYTLFCIFVITGVVLYFQTIKPVSISYSQTRYSPLPSFLNLSLNKQVTTLDLWNPGTKFVKDPKIAEPDITANSALSYDLTTDSILFSRNPFQRLPMASLTKIMTAIVALEHKKKNDKYFVTNDALVGEDSMGLDVGEVLSLNELLYGLILHSGNDSAMTIALNYPGKVKKFVNDMNQKSVSLGLSDTHFTNPTGLEGDGPQYTTAHDLLVLTKYALENFPVFDDIAATFDYIIPQTETHKEYDLENETNLISSYPGVKGVKTGYTPEAGLCLVTYLEYQNHKIIAIILGSENRRDDMKEILDYSLEQLNITPPPHS